MASYSVFPRPEQPVADNSASARAHSRFVEGSMNDRASNAPPPTFLGPDELAAYEQQFYAESNYTRSSRPTSGSEQSFNRNSGSKFWEGIREKFTRAKSSSSITTVSSGKSKASNRFSQQSEHSQQGIAAASAPNEKENVPGTGYYPSREEVMENYKSLVDAGFFSSHAIQGRRHQPPQSVLSPRKDQPLPTPPAPVRDAPPAPFSDVAALKQCQPQQQNQAQTNPAAPAISSLFASIPYSATQPSPTGDAPKTTYARPDPRPPISLPKKYRRQQPPLSQMAPPPAASPSRGTKRANADMTGGSVDREMANISTDNLAADAPAGAGARKLVKKLRKSASRISADLSLRPATSAGNTHANNHPYGLAVPGGSSRDIRGMSSTSVNFVPRPPISSTGRTVGSVVRSLSNSFKRDSGRAASGNEPAPQQQPPPAPPATQPPAPSGPNKLLKAKRSLARRVSLGRPGSSSKSSSSVSPAPTADLAHSAFSSLMGPPVPPHHRRQYPASVAPSSSGSEESSIPTSSSRQPCETKQSATQPMVLDIPDASVDADPESPIRRDPSMDVQPGGLSVPSFHYPQRQKRPAAAAGAAPLAVVPEPNRGVPDYSSEKGASYPAARSPAPSRHFKSGSFCFGGLPPPPPLPADASRHGTGMALGDDEEMKENGEFAVY